MLTSHKNVRKALIALTTALAASAVLTTTASARFDDSNLQGHQGVTQLNAGSGGVTPTDLARAVPRESNAPAGVTPTDLARSVTTANDTPQLVKSAKSDPVWNSADRDLAIGFGLGIALALVCSVALAMSRNRFRIAHA